MVCPSIADVISVFTNLIVATAAGGGAIAAWVGLTTWKKQLRWESDHDLARRLLISIYRFRDSIFGVRHPVVFPHEMEPDEADNYPRERADVTRYNGLGRAYQRRWQKVYDVRAELYSLLLEAEAVWGDELSSSFEKIATLENELFGTLQLYIRLRDPNEDEETKVALDKIYRGKRDIIYDRLDDDEYRKDFSKALEPFEKIVRSKLEGHPN